jgi:hypothetical protein
VTAIAAPVNRTPCGGTWRRAMYALSPEQRTLQLPQTRTGHAERKPES